MGLKLGWFGLDSRPNQDAESLAGGGTAWGTAPQEFWAMVSPVVNATSGGTALVRQWYRLVVDPMAVVSPRNDGGTTST